MPVIIHIILIVNVLIIYKTIGISIKVNPVSISIRSNYKGMAIGVAVNSSVWLVSVSCSWVNPPEFVIVPSLLSIT